jgi:hypothetical protein
MSWFFFLILVAVFFFAPIMINAARRHDAELPVSVTGRRR